MLTKNKLKWLLKTGFNIFKEKMKQSENNIYYNETKF